MATFRVTYHDESGRVVGYLSRNMLMARDHRNALVTDAVGLPSAKVAAARLLDGPHPLDHLGYIRVGCEEV